ncbi:MAG: hypothetical protein BIFFINMI_03775 [Phycisphaerae bacterium]|nr:hypothetical protein [Phycisphaerae bacterium]
MKSISLIALTAGLVFCLTSTGLAADGADAAPPATTQPAALKVEPVLKADPAVAAALDKLGDNSSCVLGDPKIIEDLGDFAKGWHNMKQTGPTGRDFSIKMAWMPDRKRAFYCGANHGSPHRFNDAWEYDLAANTWVLLYVPDYNDRGGITDYDKQVLTLDHGWLRTKKGGPAHPAHTWWGLTYDPTIRAAVWYCVWPPYRLKEKLDAIGKDKSDLYPGPPIWCFYPYTGKWEPMPTEKPWPKSKLAASLEFVPDLGAPLLQFESTSWLLDTHKRTWKEYPSGKASLPIETIVCYDPGRKLLIAQTTARKTYHCPMVDGKPAGWEQTAEGADLPLGHDARCSMYFDPMGKVALLYERGPKQLWAYDPDPKKWTKLTPQGPPPPFGERESVLAYMDTARNAFTVVGYNSVWCYRFKRADAAKAPPAGQ